MSAEEQFAETQEYQIKLLSYMLNNHEFCDIARDALKSELFSDRALQWYFDTLTQASPRLTQVTLQEELIKAAKAKRIRPTELDKYLEYYEFLKTRPLPVEEQYIREKLGKFIRRQAVKTALVDAFDYAKQERWDEIVDSMTAAVNAGVDSLDAGYFYFENIQDRLASRMNAQALEKLTTGIPELDSMLYGGIKPKQLGLIAGGTGRGKSIFLEWLARVAVLLGKKVVYYTLELSEEDVADRFDALFSQIKINELKTYNNQVFNALSPLSSKFSDHLVIKEYPADTATVGTIKAHLRQLSGVGFIPDLVIVDYLDLLKPHRHYNSTHEELDSITKALHGFAKEYETRVWTATQLNRAGLVMETPDETTIAGAVSKLFTADIAMFLAATAEEREDQELRIVVAKNRNGPAPRTIKIDTDYARMTFYKPSVQPNMAPTATAAAAQTSSPAPSVQPSDLEDDSPVEEGVVEEGDVLILE